MGILPWDVCSISLTHMVIIILNGICLQCRKPQFDSWVGKIPWRRARLPTPVFLGLPLWLLVNNPPAMWETWVRSLGWEDPLEKGKATHSSILAWRIPWTTVRGVAKNRTQVSDFHFHFPLILSFLSGSLLTYVSLFHSIYHVS